MSQPDEVNLLRKELREAQNRIEKLTKRVDGLEGQLKKGLKEADDSSHQLFSETREDFDMLQGQVKPLESQLERHVESIVVTEIAMNAIVEVFSQHFGNHLIQPGNVTLRDHIERNREASGPYRRQYLRDGQ